MRSQRSYNILNSIAILCGAWHIMLGWLWWWYLNVIFVFPVAILGAILWYLGRKADRKILNTIAGVMLLIGTAFSLGVFLYFFMNGRW